jgi:hypothetical protein
VLCVYVGGLYRYIFWVAGVCKIREEVSGYRTPHGYTMYSFTHFENTTPRDTDPDKK